MISKINIQNFKSLEKIELECTNLNVLTGLNGMGKSSIIQALLLLRQSYDKGYLNKIGLTLNGDLVKIGAGRDALYKGALKEEINFDLDFRNDKHELVEKSWILGYSKNIEEEDDIENYYSSDVLPFAQDYTPEGDINNLSLFTDKFRYLNADRHVQNEYERSDFNVIKNKNLGKNGEYTAHFLDHYGDNKKMTVADSLLYPGTTGNQLIYQVSSWMNEVSPGIVVKTFSSPGSQSVELRYEYPTSAGSDVILPTNTGFGVTYVLPVLVALLSSKPGDILVIENPESHLHPKGQSVLGKLIANVANLGVQIFIETHSDHLLNGIRVAVKKGVPSEKVNLFFIDQVNGNSRKVTPILDQEGRIDSWPVNFFDEWDNNLMELI